MQIKEKKKEKKKVNSTMLCDWNFFSYIYIPGQAVCVDKKYFQQELITKRISNNNHFREAVTENRASPAKNRNRKIGKQITNRDQGWGGVGVGVDSIYKNWKKSPKSRDCNFLYLKLNFTAITSTTIGSFLQNFITWLNQRFQHSSD